MVKKFLIGRRGLSRRPGAVIVLALGIAVWAGVIWFVFWIVRGRQDTTHPEEARRESLESDSALRANINYVNHLFYVLRWPSKVDAGQVVFYMRAGFDTLSRDDKEKCLASVSRVSMRDDDLGKIATVMDSTGDVQYGYWIRAAGRFVSVGQFAGHRLADWKGPGADSLPRQ